MQSFLQAQQPLALLFRQLGDGHPGPHGDNIRNVAGNHHAVAPLVFRGPLILGALQLLLQFFLFIPQGRGAFKVLGIDGGSLVDLNVLNPLFQVLQVLRRGEGAQPHPGGRLVDQVDGLVGEIPVRNIPGGELHSGINGLIGDGHLVVGLIPVFQALQNLDGLFLCGLPHHDGLEPALQGGVLFNVLAVLVDGGGADDLEITPGQGGLQDVGSIRRAFGGTGADDGVQLVNEQDDIAVLLHLVNSALDALLKVAAVLGAGHHAGQVQGHQALVFQQFRHFTRLDFQGQALGHSGFAHTGLADEHGVVFRAAAQDLDDPLDLVLAANDRVDLALGGQLGQIPAELIQGPASLLPLFPIGRMGLPLAVEGGVVQHGRELGDDAVGVGSQNLQEAHGVALAILDDGDEKMLSTHIRIVKLRPCHGRHLQDTLGAGGELLCGKRSGLSCANAFPDELLVSLCRYAQLIQHGVGHAGSFL